MGLRRFVPKDVEAIKVILFEPGHHLGPDVERGQIFLIKHARNVHVNEYVTHNPGDCEICESLGYYPIEDGVVLARNSISQRRR